MSSKKLLAAQRLGPTVAEGSGQPFDGTRLPALIHNAPAQGDEEVDTSVLQIIIQAANEEEQLYDRPQAPVPRKQGNPQLHPIAPAAAGSGAAAPQEKRPTQRGSSDIRQPMSSLKAVLLQWKNAESAGGGTAGPGVMHQAHELSSQIRGAGDEAVRCHAWLHRRLHTNDAVLAHPTADPPAPVLEEVWTSSRHATARLRRRRRAAIAVRLAVRSSRPNTSDGPGLQASRPGTRDGLPLCRSRPSSRDGHPSCASRPRTRDGPASSTSNVAGVELLPQIHRGHELRTGTPALNTEPAFEAANGGHRLNRDSDGRDHHGRSGLHAAPALPPPVSRQPSKRGQGERQRGSSKGVGSPSDNPSNLPELPRLRNRFRDQSKILRGLWQQQAATQRRAYSQAAKQLGLERADLDPSQIYTADMAYLRAAAMRKLEHKRHDAAVLIQRKWHVFRGRKKLASAMQTLMRAILRLQRWWRRQFLRALLRKLKHSEKARVAAAMRIQALFRGSAGRSRLRPRQMIHRVVLQMEHLQRQFVGERPRVDARPRSEASARGA
mmetsp:Transcript_86253/g.252277  ORF Transcript_86253/g.252277 Transcript_86253/m.252277 type:complete len:550 (+) Transcript_86253:245-1894(+)